MDKPLNVRLMEMSRGVQALRDAYKAVPGETPFVQDQPQQKSGTDQLGPYAQAIEELQHLTGIVLSDRHREKLLDLMRHESATEWLRRMRSGLTQAHLQDLIEAITVHETYFYRDASQFEHLRTEILPAIIQREMNKPSPTIRIWSAACSSGEEAYTLAMMTLDALLEVGQAQESISGDIRVNPRWKLELLGTDISQKIVDFAKNGRYSMIGLNAFRGMPQKLLRFFGNTTAPLSQAHHFEENHLEIKDFLRRLVSFKSHNLLDSILPIEQCDIILCRNVLIYFNIETRRRVQSLLHKALSTGGTLMLGPPDTLLLQEEFESRWKADSVCYIKK